MNIIREAVTICYSLPLLGSAMRTLLHLFSSVNMTTLTKSSASSEEDNNDFAAADNRAAQVHFRQIQHIRCT
ncbi:hypothetical protein PanWU01x14_274240 [Parasponia andersonii]|uniref:Uncharacterized protein n=1 Tax=Parasponia andersonii TaxID=3476 RepID=A0A2P5B3Q6_PARAD|nr:hypothetical protein PanWU01x14_274240 [Parasponia andersonii]